MYGSEGMDGHLALEIGFGIQAFVIVVLVVWCYQMREMVADLEGGTSKLRQQVSAISDRLGTLDLGRMHSQLTNQSSFLGSLASEMKIFSGLSHRLEKVEMHGSALKYLHDQGNASEHLLESLASEVNGLRERVLAQPGPSKVAEQNNPKRVSWGELKKIASRRTMAEITGAN